MKKIEFEIKNIANMWEYVNLDKDENYLNVFNNKLSLLPIHNQEEVKDLIRNINKNMALIDDRYNQIIFDNLYDNTFELQKITKINEFVEKLSVKDYETIYNMFPKFDEYIDEDIYDTDTLYDIINEDFKKDGMESTFVYLIQPYLNLSQGTEYVKINAYENGFDKTYDYRNDMLEETFENNYEEIINEYFKEVYKTNSNEMEIF